MYLGEPLQYYQSSNSLPQGAQTDCLCVNLKSCFVLTLPVVVDLSLHQSLLLCFAQHLESLCSLLTCLHLNLSCLIKVCSTPRVTLLILDLSPSFRHNLSCFVLLNTSTRSARCSVVSAF